MTPSHTYRLLVTALLGIALFQPAAAQSTPASPNAPYFHEAAQQYLDGALQPALATVNEGLRADPGNPRLQALREKIQQQRESSSNSEDDDADQNPSQDDPSSSQQQDAEQQDDASNAEQDDSSAGQQQEKDEQSPEDTAQDDPSSDSGGERSAPEETRPQEGKQSESELSRAQADRILRALENQEMQLLRQVQKRTPRSRRIEKEW